MAKKRADDPQGDRSFFRSDRLVNEGGQWFFLTREGTVEGPFESELEARQRLDAYAKVMGSQMITEDAEAVLKS